VSTPPFLRLPAFVQATRLTTSRGELAALEAVDPSATPRSTVLLVPGFTGSKEDFIAVLEPLAKAGYRVVALDQRGQFESPAADDDTAYAVPALAQDVMAAAAAVSDRPVHLLGHSFGGLIARTAAQADPTALRSLTLMSTGPAPLPPGRRIMELRMLLAAIAETDLPTIWALRGELEREAGEVVLPPDIEDFLRRRFVANCPRGLRVMAEALLDESDEWEDLALRGLPTHVIYGESDDGWPPEIQDKVAFRLSSEVSVISGAAHSPAAEQPARTANRLLDFWAAVDGG
jgi:pimeloyl-ACP methyl ester carboxylesterase